VSDLTNSCTSHEETQGYIHLYTPFLSDIFKEMSDMIVLLFIANRNSRNTKPEHTEKRQSLFLHKKEMLESKISLLKKQMKKDFFSN
jgi:hypothetical protein